MLMNDSLVFITNDEPKQPIKIAVFNIELVFKTIIYLVFHKIVATLARRSSQTDLDKNEASLTTF